MAEKPGLLARKLQQNWLTRFPDNRATGLKDQVDDSLTNLNWLPNFDCRNALPSNQSSSGGSANGPISMMNSGGMASPGPFLSLAFQQNMSIASLPQPTPPDSPVPPMAPFAQRSISCDSSFSAPPLLGVQTLTEKESAFYRTNKHVKPPYSYADLICMAMRDLRKSKITLSDIYNWIQDNFIFYQNADQSWQNSVRHNLSLNKFFQKVPRRKDEPGKGGFWRINPDCVGDTIENTNAQGMKRRRNLPPLSPSTGAGAKRLRPSFSHLHTQQQQQHQQHQHLFGQHQQQHIQPNFYMSRHYSFDESSAYACYAENEQLRSAALDPFMSSNGMNNSNLNSMLPQDEGLLQAMSKASQASVTSHAIMTNARSGIAGSGPRLSGIAVEQPANTNVTSAQAPIHLPSTEPQGASPRRVSSGGSTSSGATPPLPAGDEFLEGFLAAELEEEVDMDLPPIDLQNGVDGDALDLTVHGVSLKPPEWWNSSLSSEKSILGPTLLSSLSGSFGRNGKIFGDGRLNATPSPLMIEENQLDLDQLDQLLGLN